jgi:3'-phosphoadenosine 5'-phosphosulfate sulfotransferase (PAPS reductase)/FAD synthetase
MKKIRHVLGISGGKDSAALAIYMKNNYPQLDIEYYTCDTGKELADTYQLVENLEIYLGKKITKLKAADGSNEDPFDHFLKMYGGYLPSSNSRWCTKKLKLDPFEKFIGDDPVVSYVGIRGDEDREGYISKKTNIQSIFPFRKNIWSEDVIAKLLSNSNLGQVHSYATESLNINPDSRFVELLGKVITPSFSLHQKLNLLLDTSVTDFNELVFAFLKTTDYPLSQESSFPLVADTNVLVRDDIFQILRESGVGVPKYYEKIDFTVSGKMGQYSRSRSGCYFCFFQQKIEWIWLYEQHPEHFTKAMEYEKDGYTWCQDEKLSDLIEPQRMQQIKEDYIKRTNRSASSQSKLLVDILDDSEGEGCISCFV